MRKANYLTRLNYKDERLCSLVKNCHHVSQAQALLIVSRNRLDSFEKQGVLRKLYYMDNNRQEVVYELTKEGRDWISRNFSHLRGNFYTASTAIQHNVALAREIMSRVYSHTQWLTERDLKQVLLREIEQSDNRFELMRQLEDGRISVPDGGYYRKDGSIECIEIVSENYGSAALQAKANFEAITNIPITYITQ